MTGDPYSLPYREGYLPAVADPSVCSRCDRITEDGAGHALDCPEYGECDMGERV